MQDFLRTEINKKKLWLPADLILLTSHLTSESSQNVCCLVSKRTIRGRAKTGGKLKRGRVEKALEVGRRGGHQGGVHKRGLASRLDTSLRLQ
jgi:hypothetical protein